MCIESQHLPVLTDACHLAPTEWRGSFLAWKGYILKVDVVEVTGIFENSEFFTCFLMLMIRMPETAKIAEVKK